MKLRINRINKAYDIGIHEDGQELPLEHYLILHEGGYLEFDIPAIKGTKVHKKQDGTDK